MKTIKTFAFVSLILTSLLNCNSRNHKRALQEACSYLAEEITNDSNYVGNNILKDVYINMSHADYVSVISKYKLGKTNYVALFGHEYSCHPVFKNDSLREMFFSYEHIARIRKISHINRVYRDTIFLNMVDSIEKIFGKAYQYKTSYRVCKDKFLATESNWMEMNKEIRINEVTSDVTVSDDEGFISFPVYIYIIISEPINLILRTGRPASEEMKMNIKL